MKTLKTSLLCFLFFTVCSTTEAQFLKKLGKKAEEAAERAVVKKTEQKVTKETEKVMDSILNPKTGKMEKRKKTDKKDDTSSNDSNNKKSEQNNDKEKVKKNTTAWSKYNFVPGDEIIFYDDLTNEESGEFPSRWDLFNGNAENASIDEEKVINMLHRAKITPLMDKDKYLPEVFTIEFDAFFKRIHGPTYQNYYIGLWAGTKNYGYSEDGKSYCERISLNMHGASMTCLDNGNKKEYSSYDESIIVPTGEPIWRHIAIAFNKRSLKVFIDEKRVLNIPNLDYKPSAFAIETYGPYGELSAIKNIRIAKGGKKLYDRLMSDGKFVTRGILFDINKATIRPESYGVINTVAKMMNEHKDLKFNIEGHTDSDGEEDYNLKLSAKRAIAVKTALQEMGISEDRLQTEGKGEGVPVSENNSPEGKANNRRVEFIKI